LIPCLLEKQKTPQRINNPLRLDRDFKAKGITDVINRLVL